MFSVYSYLCMVWIHVHEIYVCLKFIIFNLIARSLLCTLELVTYIAYIGVTVVVGVLTYVLATNNKIKQNRSYWSL